MLLSYRNHGNEHKSVLCLNDTFDRLFIYAHFMKLEGHTEIEIDGEPLENLYTKQ